MDRELNDVVDGMGVTELEKKYRGLIEDIENDLYSVTLKVQQLGVNTDSIQEDLSRVINNFDELKKIPFFIREKVAKLHEPRGKLKINTE